ncbi:MAG: hypothetical protein Q9228_004895 [Teloschistes exilis]
MADHSRGYAGIHSTIFAAIQFLNHLEPADVSTIVAEDRICAICSEALSEPPDQAGHWAVRLSGCGHVFGKSCLDIWLTPFDKESQEFPTEDSEYEEEEEDDDEEEEGEGGEEQEDEYMDDVDERGVGRDPEVRDQGAAAAEDCPNLLMEAQSTSPDLDNVRPDHNPIETSGTSNVSSAVHEEAMPDVPEHQSMGVDNKDSEDDILYPSDEFVAHLYTLASWHPATTDNEMDIPVCLQGEWLLRPALLYENGPYQAGFAPTPLGPGYNTCPLCRCETFPRPKHGDSVMALTVRLHVWNTAYRYLGIQHTVQDQLYINEVGLFMRRRFDTWASNQVDPYTVTYAGMAEAFMNALHSLVGTGVDVEYGALVERWTSRDMHRLWIFGESWKFSRVDWAILFRLNPKDHLVAADVTQLPGWNQHYSERLTETRRDIEASRMAIHRMDLQISNSRR